MQTSPPLIRVSRRDGVLTYLVDLAPEDMPPVSGRDLLNAWDAARDAANEDAWGAARMFRFRRPDGGSTVLALSDEDARCWAGAVDGTVGMGTSYGLSLCLRLLALVDLLARTPGLVALCPIGRTGAALHPALVAAAATATLTAEARFDERGFRTRLALAPALPHRGADA